MTKQILIIHGGDAFETRDEYLNYLKTKVVTLERLRAKDWKRHLADALGPEYDVLNPIMPNGQNARYEEWKIWFERIIPLLDKSVILIGHSLGGIFLAKYLSENDYPKHIRATFLVAAPYNTPTDHPLADFLITSDLAKLAKQGGEIFLYHSKDDTVVPFSNFERFQCELPKAHCRILDDRMHINQPELPEIVEDIRSLKEVVV
jgi:uncharacterized protein